MTDKENKETEEVTETYKILSIMKDNLEKSRAEIDSQVRELESLIGQLMKREARVFTRGRGAIGRRNNLAKELASVKKAREDASRILS